MYSECFLRGCGDNKSNNNAAIWRMLSKVAQKVLSKDPEHIIIALLSKNYPLLHERMSIVLLLLLLCSSSSDNAIVFSAVPVAVAVAVAILQFFGDAVEGGAKDPVQRPHRGGGAPQVRGGGEARRGELRRKIQAEES